MAKSKKLKNKKLQRIRDTKFIIKLKRSKKNNNLIFYIEMDSALEPAVRPKSNNKMGMFYDPLASYKKEIIKNINNYIDNLDDKYKKIFPYNGPVKSDILIIKKPAKSHSMLDRFTKIFFNLPMIMKPDLDNINKTAWDSLNKIVFTDDSLIYDSRCKKLYGEKEYTIIKLYFDEESMKEEKEFRKNNKRLNKEQTEYIKSLYINDEDEIEEE